MITIVDYGVGNLASVQNMLKRCGIKSECTSSVEQIESAEKIILPGVGAFDYAIERIDQLGLRKAITKAAEAGTKILGICLGAQLLMERSEEGQLAGLSLIKGFCKKFDKDEIKSLRIPHMGWSDVSLAKAEHPLTKFDEEEPRFYFTHSYYIKCTDPSNVLAMSFYGHEFTCAVASKNVMGVQFHPEKSHVFGFKLLANFASM